MNNRIWRPWGDLPGFLMRACLVVLALGSMAGALFALPGARQNRIDRAIAANLINLESFPRSVVIDALARTKTAQTTGCPSDGRPNEMIFTAWLAAEALRLGRFEEVSGLQTQTIEAARAHLRCSPLSGFAPVVAAHMQVLTEGPHAGILPLLRLSHEHAPRELWIMLRRAHVGLMLQHVLEEGDHARLAVDLAGLVEGGMFVAAVDLLALGDGALQRRVNRAVSTLPTEQQFRFQRRAASRALSTEGLGIAPLPDRMR
jgi:hypothetical protein